MAEINLFVGKGRSGEPLVITDECVSSMETQQPDYYHKVESCSVKSGVWLLYNGDNFSHGATIVPPGDYDDLKEIPGNHMHSSNSLASLRPLPTASAATLVLFQDTNYCGESLVLDSSCPDLSQVSGFDDTCGQGAVNFSDKASSAIVVAGKWTLSDGHSNTQTLFHKDTSNVGNGPSAVTGVYPGLDHNDNAKSAVITEAHLADANSWMTGLNDNLKLSALTIPGTHDSGAVGYYLGSNTDLISQCQNMRAAKQLNVGIRFLDMRLRLEDGVLNVYHGPRFQGTTFAEWCAEIALFLFVNPKECVIMSIDYSGDNIPAGFLSAVQAALTAKYTSMNLPLNCYTANQIPTLGDVRGKVVLLRRFSCSDSSYGWACSQGWTHTDQPFTIQLNGTDSIVGQDNYDLAAMKDPAMAHKWSLIQKQLQDAQGDSNMNALYVNFVSGAGDKHSLGLPWPVDVALDNHNGAHAGMNYQLMNALAGMSGRLGLIVMDFPDKPAGLIASLIQKNTYQAGK